MADTATQSTARAALITGGSRRIGRAIALALSRAGYAVVLHAHRSRAEAETLAGEIIGQGGKASVVLADLADAEAVRGLVPAAAAFGPLTLLINSASEFVPDEIDSLARAGFERTIAVNLAAPFAVPAMIDLYSEVVRATPPPPAPRPAAATNISALVD